MINKEKVLTIKRNISLEMLKILNRITKNAFRNIKIFILKTMLSLNDDSTNNLDFNLFLRIWHLKLQL